MGKPKPRSRKICPEAVVPPAEEQGNQMIRVSSEILKHCSEYTLRILFGGSKRRKLDGNQNQATGSKPKQTSSNFVNLGDRSNGSGSRLAVKRKLQNVSEPVEEDVKGHYWDDSFEGSDAESFLNMLIPETKLRVENECGSEQSFTELVQEQVPLPLPPPLEVELELEDDGNEEEASEQVIIPPPPQFGNNNDGDFECPGSPTMPVLKAECVEPEISESEEGVRVPEFEMGCWRRELFEFKCQHCDRTYDADWKLKKHEKDHLGTWKKPYRCTGCDKTYANPYSVKRHIRKFHKGKASFTTEEGTEDGDISIEEIKKEPQPQSDVESPAHPVPPLIDTNDIITAYDVIDYLLDCVELLEIYGAERNEDDDGEASRVNLNDTRSDIRQSDNIVIQDVGIEVSLQNIKEPLTESENLITVNDNNEGNIGPDIVEGETSSPVGENLDKIEDGSRILVEDGDKRHEMEVEVQCKVLEDSARSEYQSNQAEGDKSVQGSKSIDMPEDLFHAESSSMKDDLSCTSKVSELVQMGQDASKENESTKSGSSILGDGEDIERQNFEEQSENTIIVEGIVKIEADSDSNGLDVISPPTDFDDVIMVPIENGVASKSPPTEIEDDSSSSSSSHGNTDVRNGIEEKLAETAASVPQKNSKVNGSLEDNTTQGSIGFKNKESDQYGSGRRLKCRFLWPASKTNNNKTLGPTKKCMFILSKKGQSSSKH